MPVSEHKRAPYCDFGNFPKRLFFLCFFNWEQRGNAEASKHQSLASSHYYHLVGGIPSDPTCKQEFGKEPHPDRDTGRKSAEKADGKNLTTLFIYRAVLQVGEFFRRCG